MKETIRFGRVAGIPVGAHWSLLVTLLLLAQGLATVVLPRFRPDEPTAVYWLTGVCGAVLLLAALLAHELAHSLVARHYGLPVERITLWMLGGVSILRGDPATPRAAFLIAAAGPLASLGIAVAGFAAGLALAVGGAPDLVVLTLLWLAVMNVALGLFNLLPGAPLDGGRILRAALWRRYGDAGRAARSAARAGQAVGLLLALAGVVQVATGDTAGLWMLLVGFFVAVAAQAEANTAELRQALQGLRVADAMSSPEPVGRDAMTVERFLAEVVPLTRHVAYPVVDEAGLPTGTISLLRLRELPAAAHRSTRLGEIRRPLAQVEVAGPDDALADLLLRLPATVDALALVLAGGQLVGVVGAADAARAWHLAETAPAGRTELTGGAR